MVDRYRLITTLLDEHRYPAPVLVRLYHERWEIESAFLALRHTLLGAHVLRSHDRAGIEQELWALLTLYQLLRTAMVEAIETRPGLDPDRASFTTAVQTAREQLVTATGVITADDNIEASGPGPRLGAIGTAVLATLLPPRRPRYSNRNVKCSTSRYHARTDGRPALPTTILAIDITVHSPAIDLPPTRRPRSRQRHRRPHEPLQFPPGAVRPATRRERVTAVLLSKPRHDWHGWELAELLKINKHLMLTQLSEWARLGFIERTGKGTYALDTPPPRWPPTSLTDPAADPPPEALTEPDGDEEPGELQHPQRSEHERAHGPTSTVRDLDATASRDTPTPAPWTSPSNR